MQKLRDKLAENIEPHSGLLTRLLSKEVLTQRQYQQIRSKTNVPEKNEELLSCLLDSERRTVDFEEVLESFREADQEHIANFIIHGGDRPKRTYIIIMIQFIRNHYFSIEVLINSDIYVADQHCVTVSHQFKSLKDFVLQTMQRFVVNVETSYY